MTDHPKQLTFEFLREEPIKIVGISGKRGSGKDTVCAMARELDDNVIVLAIADEIKKEVALATGESIDFVEANKEEFRGLLQHWGQYKRGFVRESYWLDRLDDKLRGIPDGSIVFISDIRYESEIRFLKKRGGLMVRINRHCPDKALEAVDHHQSETQLDRTKMDHVLGNESSRDELRKSVNKLMQWIRNPQRDVTIQSTGQLVSS